MLLHVDPLFILTFSVKDKYLPIPEIETKQKKKNLIDTDISIHLT